MKVNLCRECSRKVAAYTAARRAGRAGVPYQTKGSIIARLVDKRGREVRRVKIPGHTRYVLSLRDGKYYDRRAWSKTFAERPLVEFV